MASKEFKALWAAIFVLGVIAVGVIDMHIGQIYIIPRVSLAEAVGLLILTVGWLGTWYWEFRVVPESRLRAYSEGDDA